MFAVAFAYSDESKEAMKALGYIQQTVMIKWVGSGEDEKEKYEKELLECRPYQFAVTNFWGACPD